MYKGCSSFEISGLHEFEDVLEDGYAYGITKETCKGDDCNKGTGLNSQTQKFSTLLNVDKFLRSQIICNFCSSPI